MVEPRSAVKVSRRAALKSVAAAPVMFGFSRVLAIDADYRFVVIGGGYAGSRFARELRRLAPDVEVILVERSSLYTPCPMASLSLLADEESFLPRYDYAGLKGLGVVLIQAEVSDVDTNQKTIRFKDGQRLQYDALLLAPGISVDEQSIEGYEQAAVEQMPHAWMHGEEIHSLARQLRAMPDGGDVLVTIPPGPIRCPPAPYERATLIARYLKRFKPKSRLQVLDSNQRFSLQAEFEACWRSELSGLIERRGPDDEGRVVAVDVASRTVFSDFEQYRADVVSLIPAQKAGSLAEKIGLTDITGWCPVDPATFASRLIPDTYVIGDAALLTPMPKSAAAGIDEAEICARTWVAMYRGTALTTPRFQNQCFAFVDKEHAHSLKGTYHAEGDEIVMDEMIKAGVAGDPFTLAAGGLQAKQWFSDSSDACFGRDEWVRSET